MRSWTEQHSNHVSQNRAAQKKSLVTRVTSAFQPIVVTARLSHATHHRLAPSWVGDLNEKLPLGRGTAEFSFTRIFSATVQSLPAEPQSHKQLGFYIPLRLYDYLPQPKKNSICRSFAWLFHRALLISQESGWVVPAQPRCSSLCAHKHSTH